MRTRLVAFRAEPSEYESIQMAADIRGVSLTEFIRKASLEAARVAVPLPTPLQAKGLVQSAASGSMGYYSAGFKISRNLEVKKEYAEAWGAVTPEMVWHWFCEERGDLAAFVPRRRQLSFARGLLDGFMAGAAGFGQAGQG